MPGGCAGRNAIAGLRRGPARRKVARRECREGGVDYVIGWVRVKPGHRDVFLSLVQPFLEATRQEPGVLSYEFLLSYEDPDRFVVIERYATAEAHEAHVNAAHYATFWNLLQALVEESRFENIGVGGIFTETIGPVTDQAGSVQ